MALQARPKAFTLIELLIVVAIIAILAAIAVPNFLEAQTRSRISRSQADMRAIATALEAYRIDFGNEPRTLFPGQKNPAGPRDGAPGCSGAERYSEWWGFISPELTTPVAFITSIPRMTFYDQTVLGFWRQLGGGQDNQPYTWIRDTWIPASWTEGIILSGGIPSPGIPTRIPGGWQEAASSSSFIIYTSGPDAVDSTVWGGAMFYDPTNGTISYGDIYRFGGGSPVASQNCN